MRVLMITYHFPPDGHVGAVRPYQFARLLPNYGIEPWILTVQPQRAAFPDSTCEHEGVPTERVIRTEVLPSRRDKYLHATRWIRFLLKDMRGDPSRSGSEAESSEEVIVRPLSLRQCLIEWIGFPDWYAGWYKPAMRAVADLMTRVRFSAVWSTSFPRTAQIIGYEVSRQYKLPWIADWRDPWLHYIEGWGDPECPFIRRRYERMLYLHLEQVSMVTFNSSKLCQFWQERLPQYAGKFCAMPNGIPEELLMQDFPPVRTERLIIGYFGTVYQRSSPAVFFDGLSRWLKANHHVRDRVEVQFYSETPSINILGPARSYGIDDVVCIKPRVERGKVVELVKGSTCLLLLASNVWLKVPAKTYEYLVSNKPIIALAEPESATGMLLQGMPDCYIVSGPMEVVQVLDKLWERYNRGEALFVSRRSHLDPYSYSNLAGELAQLFRRLRLSS